MAVTPSLVTVLNCTPSPTVRSLSVAVPFFSMVLVLVTA
jgi:hypothetical protein